MAAPAPAAAAAAAAAAAVGDERRPLDLCCHSSPRLRRPTPRTPRGYTTGAVTRVATPRGGRAPPQPPVPRSAPTARTPATGPAVRGSSTRPAPSFCTAAHQLAAASGTPARRRCRRAQGRRRRALAAPRPPAPQSA
eukprot:365243-Chlamydomonas_euryale.AAC.10